MNRIEPIGPLHDDIAAIAPVPRRAPDRERDREESEQPRERQDAPVPEPAPAPEPAPIHTFDEDGEHVDVRA